MTFNQLLYLTEVAKHGSINKAAQANYISQSSISTAIKDLEEEFGIVIFKRSGKGVETTAEGKEFISYAVSLIEQKAWLEDRFKNSAHIDAPRFSVSMLHFPFAVDAFIRTMDDENSPKYNHTLQETDMEEVIKHVTEDQADIGIIYIASRNMPRLSSILAARNLRFYEITKVNPSVYIRSNHPLADKPLVGTNDLEEYPYISFLNRDGLASEFQEEYLPRESVSRPKRVYVNDRHSLLEMIKSSDSYTIGSGLIPESNASGDIVTRTLVSDDELHIGYITSNDRELSPLAKSFINYLSDALMDSKQYSNRL